jgi:protein SCO1/2
MKKRISGLHHGLGLVCLVCLGVGAGTVPAIAQQAAADHQHVQQAPASIQGNAASGPTKISIPDMEVLDQNNRRVRFYSDLVKGKTVAVNFIFTTCTTICLPMTANFAKVQKIMRARGEKNLELISVSVDPENDTPEKLKAYAEMFHAQPGWTFVTGTRAELEPIWKAFNVFAGGAKEEHAPTVVIGDEALHSWTYASGLAPASKLAGVIAAVLDSKNATKRGQREMKAARPAASAGRAGSSAPNITETSQRK